MSQDLSLSDTLRVTNLRSVRLAVLQGGYIAPTVAVLITRGAVLGTRDRAARENAGVLGGLDGQFYDKTGIKVGPVSGDPLRLRPPPTRPPRMYKLLGPAPMCFRQSCTRYTVYIYSMQDNSTSTIRIIIVSAHERCRPQQGAATCYSSSSAPASAALRLVAVRCAATPRTPCAVTWGGMWLGRGSD